MADYSKSVFIDSCKTPIKIYWTDDSLGYQETKLKGISHESRTVDLSDKTVIINGIPPGFVGVWLDINDQIDLDSMSEVEKNSIRFILYYNTKNPVNLMPDLSNIKVNYFLNEFQYPESILYVGKKV